MNGERRKDEGEWGCTQFGRETGDADRGGRAIVVRITLLPKALITFGNSGGWDCASCCDRGVLDVCAAIKDIRCNGKWTGTGERSSSICEEITIES